jgi:hypothetical protein
MTFMRQFFRVISCSLCFSVAVAQTGTGITYQPPYENQAGTLYIPTDGMFKATLPPSSPAFINTSTSGLTITAGTNGNLILTTAGNGTAYWQTQTATTSVESVTTVAPFSGALGTALYGYGPWIYDSTNGLVWALNPVFGSSATGAATCYLQIQKLTYAGGSTLPVNSAITNAVGDGCAGWGTPIHIRLSKASSTLTMAISLDGGISYQTVATESVGTIAKGGIHLQDAGASLPMTMNVLSLNVQ